MGAAILIGALVVEAAETGIHIYKDVEDKNTTKKMEQEKDDAINLQKTRANLQADDAKTSRANKEQLILSQQKAIAASSGLSMSSGSFGSIVAGSESAYAEDNKRANISLQMTQDNLQLSMDQNHIASASREEADNWAIATDALSGAGSMLSTGYSASENKSKATSNNKYTSVSREAPNSAGEADDHIANSMGKSSYYS